VNRNAVAVMTALDHGSVSQALISRGWRGCAVERYPLADIAHAHELAAVALQRAPDSAFATRVLLRDGDAEVLALLSADPMANPLAVGNAVLKDLAHRNGQHLIQALDAYLQTGDAVAAAQLTHMHPQTLRYRLRRVTALTQLDPRQPWDRYLLQTAVMTSSAAGKNRG
jgi:DNA-binding PucR family transcriptional regulator